ncbi:hypothetical protein ABBQ32_010597 [Trebouxia sp. C0010 RCD-2024]
MYARRDQKGHKTADLNCRFDMLVEPSMLRPRDSRQHHAFTHSEYQQLLHKQHLQIFEAVLHRTEPESP